MNQLPTVAVVGAGQIGSAIAAALSSDEAGQPAFAVFLFDRDPATAVTAVAMGAGKGVLQHPEQALDHDVVILAVPVLEIVAWLGRFGTRLSPGTLLLDTGSAKATVVAAMQRQVHPSVHAIGGHPITGTERPGPSADRQALAGTSFILTPVREDRTALTRASDLVSSMGCIPIPMEASLHDRLIARTSHLPHLMASALAALCSGGQEAALAERSLLGPGYRGATRLAASDPEMVASFLCANADAVLRALANLQVELTQLSEALAAGPGALATALSAARASREAMLGTSG